MDIFTIEELVELAEMFGCSDLDVYNSFAMKVEEN